MRRKKLRRHAVESAAILVLIPAALTACGDDEDEAQSVRFEVSGSKVTSPSSAEAGTAEITLDNNGKSEADLQLIRTEGDHSAQEVVKALGGVVDGIPIPDWFFAGGGVGTTASGQSQTVTEVLEPGTYWAVNTNTDGPPNPDTVTSFEVTGDASAEELEADTEVEAIDYGFKASGLRSGENEILFANIGAQPHHILASKAIGNATAADSEKYFKSGVGKPPLRQKGTQSTAVIEGGESQLVTLDLEPGKYILYCFITDRQGGPPHALKGMVDEVEVK